MKGNYKCRNGAWHDNICCDTCWNNHPEAIKGKMFLGSKQHEEIIKADWIQKARDAGFTLEQAVFIYAVI